MTDIPNYFLISVWGIFITIGVFYSIILLFCTNLNINSFNFLCFIFIFTIIFLLLYIFFVINKLVLNGNLNFKVFFYILICLFSIIFPIFFILCIEKFMKCNSFIQIFENTIGYFLICLPYFSDYTTNLSNYFMLNDKINCNSIKNLIDLKYLITLINCNTFNEDYTKIHNSQVDIFFNVGDNEKIQRVVNEKNRYGILCWFYLTSAIAVIITTKYIVNIT
jgi:hypothetical protein